MIRIKDFVVIELGCPTEQFIAFVKSFNEKIFMQYLKILICEKYTTPELVFNLLNRVRTSKPTIEEAKNMFEYYSNATDQEVEKDAEQESEPFFFTADPCEHLKSWLAFFNQEEQEDFLRRHYQVFKITLDINQAQTQANEDQINLADYQESQTSQDEADVNQDDDSLGESCSQQCESMQRLRLNVGS